MLTHLLAMNGTPGELIYNSINPDQVAASGWSLGGYAAMALAGGDDSVCDIFPSLGFPNPPPETCVPTYPDPRISAIVTLDGSTQVLHFDELARIDVPTMGIGQEWSTLYAIFGPGMASWQARLHAASQGHPCYRVDLAEAYHPTFSNLCEAAYVLYDKGILDEAGRDGMAGFACAAPIPTSLAYQLTTKYMIAFLKKNLAGEQGYQNILTSGYAHNEPYIEFFVTEKRNPNAIDDDWPGYFVYFMHQPGSAHAKAAKDPEQSLPIPHMGLRK
jgi:predicted dienelactone hydrolase